MFFFFTQNPSNWHLSFVQKKKLKYISRFYQHDLCLCVSFPDIRLVSSIVVRDLLW
jgi:hypothetical protein